MKKRVISIFMCIVLGAVLAVGCSSDSSKEKTDAAGEETDASEDDADNVDAPDGEEKELTVVGTGSFYPVIYTDENGDLTGFEHDVIEEIAERAGFEVTWELSDDYGAMFSGIDSGKYDTIAALITETDERKETYDFSEVYAASKTRMAVRGDDPAESVDDLQGRKVCIEYGTVLETFFNDYNADLPDDKKIELVVTSGNIYDELAVGHYDAFPIVEISFDSVNEKGEYNFKLVGDPIMVSYQAFPFSKDADPEKLEAFNAALIEMREDGTLAELSEQYYKRDVTDAIE